MRIVANDDRVRYSIYMDKALSDYLEDEAKRLGISKSGYFNMVVSNDKLQKDVMHASKGLSQVSEMLMELKSKMDK